MDGQYVFTGKHLIAGGWVATTTTFQSAPATGAGLEFCAAGSAQVERAAAAAENSFASFAASSRDDRAILLETIADEIDARGDAITAIASAETALPEARLVGERGRTVGQLRLFASHIRLGTYLDQRHDPALPDRQPLPRPDLRLVQRPVGPVAVFGASNFPLAFSTAGGDTAAALAAGCPVIVKGHPAHPGTGEIVASSIAMAVQKCGFHPGIFSFLQGYSTDLGKALVTHPLIRAVGFTGSLRAGRALFDLCAGRPEPVPFFGELGSTNPVFVLPAAGVARAAQIGTAWASSLTMGVGQFCTNPGVVFVQDGLVADALVAAAKKVLSAVAAQTMLTTGMAESYRSASAAVQAHDKVQTIFAVPASNRQATPAIVTVSASDWLAAPELQHEIFGPFGIVVRVAGEDDLTKVAASLTGQLTCTLQMDAADHAIAARLLAILERKAGRILANGFPTGVEVANAMVHGGPYPASTNFGATSVGTMAIRRFLRPVCFQDMPLQLLPTF